MKIIVSLCYFFCLFLIVGCASASKQYLRNIKDEHGKVMEQFAVSETGQRYHAKRHCFGTFEIFFISKTKDGNTKIIKPLRSVVVGELWFALDVTNPERPKYISAAVVTPTHPGLKIDGEIIAEFEAARVKNDGIPEVDATFKEELELKEVELLPSSLSKLPNTVPTWYYPCTIIRNAERYYVNKQQVKFLIYDNMLIAFADISVL